MTPTDIPSSDPQPTLSGMDVSDLRSGGPNGDAPVAMVTGHRRLHHPDLVFDRLCDVLTRLEPASAVSGGAEGADSAFARAALAVGVPLRLFLPNQFYRRRYPAAVPDEIMDAASEVVYVVDRMKKFEENPSPETWRTLWDDERWWRDNFARNRAMLKASSVVTVVSDRRPKELASEKRGGTASCVRDAGKMFPGGQALWVPDDPALAVRWTPFT